MTSYVALPIVCFYLFNKPEYFKEELASTKQYYLIREDQQGVCFILTYFIILQKYNNFNRYFFLSFCQIERLHEFKSQREKDKEKLILAEIEALKSKQK